jgi:hypothetical protein
MGANVSTSYKPVQQQVQVNSQSDARPDINWSDDEKAKNQTRNEAYKKVYKALYPYLDSGHARIAAYNGNFSKAIGTNIISDPASPPSLPVITTDLSLTDAEKAALASTYDGSPDYTLKLASDVKLLRSQMDSDISRLNSPVNFNRNKNDGVRMANANFYFSILWTILAISIIYYVFVEL